MSEHSQTQYASSLSVWWKLRYLIWSVQAAIRGRRSKDVTFD